MDKRENFKKFKEAVKSVLTVLSWTAFSLLVAIGLFLVYYVISAMVYSSKGEEFKPPIALYTIISPSMEPKIKVYDVIINKKVTDASTLKVGDIITFTSTSAISDGYTITHRIVDIIEDNGELKFRTKGDNNNTPDGTLVSEMNIHGKVLMKIPQLGRIQFLLASKGGWFFAILLPALGVIIYDILKLFKLVGVQKKIDESNKKSEPNIKKIDEEQKRKEDLKEKLNIQNPNQNDDEIQIEEIVIEDLNDTKDLIKEVDDLEKIEEISIEKDFKEQTEDRQIEEIEGLDEINDELEEALNKISNIAKKIDDEDKE